MRKYIKLNNNDEHLSIGNLFRVIKELSVNKSGALQTEIFCILFNVENINNTTVNNYCVGCRSLKDEYKQLYLNYKRRFIKDKNCLVDTINALLSIIDGVIYTYDISSINNNKSCVVLCNKLYNIAKNDKGVSNEYRILYKNLINSKDYYDCLVNLLFYIIIEKKQPIYETDIKKNVLESIVGDTNISASDLEEYLSLKLKEGINYYNSMIKLASSGNAYANYEMGCEEYYGNYKGYPRYDIAYNYFLAASNYDHASACYMIGIMFLNGLIGGKSNDELQLAYDYLKKAMELGNVAAINVIGNMYLNGVYPLEKDENKAINYYKEAITYNYSYAYNNLGNIYESKNDLKNAFNNYLISANNKESWACNKVGEFYRLGLIEKDMKKAFNYYNDATLSTHRNTCFYAYYNLAKYYYLNGCLDIVLNKDENKAIEYFKISYENGVIDSLIELFYIYYAKYLDDKTYEDEMLKYKILVENEKLLSDDDIENINKNVNIIKNSRQINV